MARRRGTSQGLTCRGGGGGGGGSMIWAPFGALVVVIALVFLAGLSVAAGLDIGGIPALAAATQARPEPGWQVPSNEKYVEDALPQSTHRRRLEEFLTDDPDEPTDDEFGVGSDEFGDESDGWSDGSDGGEDLGGTGDGGADGTSDGTVVGSARGVDPEGAEPDSSGNSTSATGDASGQGDGSSTTGDQGTGGEDAGGQGNETSAGDVPGNTTDGEGGEPAPSPAAQPSPENSDGEGGGPSAPSADQSPPASAPADETPAPTRRPSHSANSTPEAPAAAPHAGAPPSTDDQIQDQWKDESYADMAKAQYDSMVHDRNVVIVASVFGALGFVLLLITAQQMIENPDGCCAKVCRCSIAFWRVVCWPCRKVCGCAKPKRRGHAVVAGGDNDYGGYSHDLELT